MNSKLRIVSLAVGLGLAGVVTVTWGAESVVQLISHGEVAIRELKASRAAYENANKKNTQLNTESQQIAADNQKLNDAIAAYKKQAAAVQTQIDDYNSKCSGKITKRSVYDWCKKNQPLVAKAASDVNAIPPKLNRQQKALQARSDQYNKDMETLKTQAPKIQKEYTDKLNKDEDWLNKVRNFVGSAAVQPYAKKAHCPDTKVIAKNVAQVVDQSEKYLACLKKIAGT